MGILIKIEFKRSNKDEGVFPQPLPNSLAIIFIHIDDSSIITRMVKEMIELKNQIKSHLECDNMGELSWMLEIEIKRDRQKWLIRLSQETYIRNILERYGFQDIKPVVTPVDPSIDLNIKEDITEEEQEYITDKQYRGAIGALMYLVVRTRSDIAYATITTARYSNDL